MSENDDECGQRDQETQRIKQIVKASFKMDLGPPDTQVDFYSIGRVIGRGSFGKVSLARHKLT